MIRGSSIQHTQSSYKMKLLTLCFLAILTLLIGQVLANGKDINDTWILEGVFPLFLLFVITYVVTVSFSSNLKLISIVTSVYLAIISLLPNLKYVFVYGLYDPIGHYGFIRDIRNWGSVPDVGVYASSYGSNPGSHIFAAELSLITGLNALVCMKVLLVTSPFILPLAVYLLMRRLNVSFGFSKIMIIATAVTSPVLYIYTGTSSIYYAYVLFMYFWLLFASRNNDTRANLVICIILGTRIIISHSVTSFFLLLYLLSALGLHFSAKKVMRSSSPSTRAPVLLGTTLVLMISAYFVFASKLNFSTLLCLVRDSLISIFGWESPRGFEYYGGLFALTIADRVKVLAVRFAKDGVCLFLLVLAPLAIFRLKLKDINLRRFFQALVLPTSLSLSMFVLSLFIRPFVRRGLTYLWAFCPFLVGITIYWLICSRSYHFKNAVLAVAVISLISTSILQIYPFQPLLPRVQTRYGDYYVADWRQVSTSYTRSMISFVATYDLRLDIKTDRIIRWQIFGLTNSTFQSFLSETDAPLILASHTGAAYIIPSASSAIANEQYLQSALQETSVIYANCESYVLLNMTIGT